MLQLALGSHSLPMLLLFTTKSVMQVSHIIVVELMEQFRQFSITEQFKEQFAPLEYRVYGAAHARHYVALMQVEQLPKQLSQLKFVLFGNVPLAQRIQVLLVSIQYYCVEQLAFSWHVVSLRST